MNEFLSVRVEINLIDVRFALIEKTPHYQKEFNKKTSRKKLLTDLKGNFSHLLRIASHHRSRRGIFLPTG